MSKTIFIRGAVLAAATMLALTACGGAEEAPAEEERDGAGTSATEEEAPEDDAAADADAEGSDSESTDSESTAEDTDTADSEESGDAEDGSDDAAESSEEGGDTAAAEPTVVEIGTEFTDEETGDVITVVSAVRHNPTEFYQATDNPDGEMIYLEVAVTPGDIYGGVVSQQDFYLSTGGEEIDYAASADDEMIAAGYDYYDGPSRRDGEATGFIPIYLESTGDTLTGAYVRPEMKVLGEDTTVPEFRAEFEVPAA